MEGKLFGPRLQSFQPACEKTNKPMLLGVTVHWAEVYLRIWEEHFAQWRGDTRHQATGNRAFQLLLLAGALWCVLLSQQVSRSVVNLRSLPSTSRTGFWADGMDGTCEPQIVALPSVREGA